ncbi:unnamed protein product [Blepharisma stoltei]|uniref:Uncharacterized protein n=1 Tax=Blepharisma stoltei TaxID=1481888 RepID=A0AAU9JB84_9CILI|nr:unnamed protein product [Blepharisma stoltei]
MEITITDPDDYTQRPRIFSLNSIDTRKSTNSLNIHLPTPKGSLSSYSRISLFSPKTPKTPKSTRIKYKNKSHGKIDFHTKEFYDKNFSPKNVDSEIIKSVLAKTSHPTTANILEKNRQKLYEKPALPKIIKDHIKLPKHPVEPSKTIDADGYLTKIHSAESLKKLKFMVRATESDLSAKIDDLKKLTKADLQEFKEIRARRWNRTKFRDFENELTGKEIYNILKRLKNQLKKFVY